MLSFRVLVILTIITILPLFTMKYTSSSLRIINGGDALTDQFPSSVSIRYNRTGQHLCGGGLINSRWVLTAAHCVVKYRSTRSIFVTIGSIDLKCGNNYSVEFMIAHPQYNKLSSPKYKHDIGLIKLNESIAAASLFSDESYKYGGEILNGMVCRFSGWGDTSFPAPIRPIILQQINLTTLPIDECNNLLKNIAKVVPLDSKTQICTKTIKRRKGTCRGDSGGSLICNENSLDGLLSFGVPCATGNYPDVFTKVAYYTEWINKTISSSRDSYLT